MLGLSVMAAASTLAPAHDQEFFDEISAAILPYLACEREFAPREREIAAAQYLLNRERRESATSTRQEIEDWDARGAVISEQRTRLTYDKRISCPRHPTEENLKGIIRTHNPDMNEPLLDAAVDQLFFHFGLAHFTVERISNNEFTMPVRPPVASPQ